MVSDSRTKRDVWTFLMLLLLFSSVFYGLVFVRPAAAKQWGTYTLAFMWCPGLAALITNLVRNRTLRGLGWGMGTNALLLDRIRSGDRHMPAPSLVVWFAFDAFNGSQLVARPSATDACPCRLHRSRACSSVSCIWAAWHYPINVAVSPLYRPNVPLWYSNACFTLLVIGASFVHTWLRMRSKSLWPSALFHAAGNGFQGFLQAATLRPVSRRT